MQDAGAVGAAPRRQRADAARNSAALVEAARAVFAASGVDAPVKEVADRAGVGVGTLYRAFPTRSDLVVAVFQQAVDACAQAAPALAASHEPAGALERWLLRFTGFVATKRGLSAALHSGDPAFSALPDYFLSTLGPVLQQLLDTAAAAGQVRGDVSAQELLFAVSRLSEPVPGDDDGASPEDQRMVTLLVDGLRYGARPGGAPGGGR